MEWRRYRSTCWRSGWKNETQVTTYVADFPEKQSQFIIYERYNKKGQLKDYVAYCKTEETKKVAIDFGNRVIQTSFSSYEEAMRRCNTIADAILDGDMNFFRFFRGTEYIDDNCPARETSFD